MKNYLDELNTEQKKAVEHINGPLMVIAGAGSGKTRVLTYRIVHLLNNKISPFKILAPVSYTHLTLPTILLV